MRHIYLHLLAVLVAVALAGCAGGSGGTARSLTGQWAGTISDSIAGNGNVTVAISQSGNSFVGTWQATFADMTNGGSLQGQVNGNSVVLQLYPSSASACPYNVVASWSGNTLSGNYSAFNCSISITGTLVVQKQQ